MSYSAAIPGRTHAGHPLKQAFLKWQCRVRQMAMRDAFGRPDDAITPAVYLDGGDTPLGHVITILNRAPGCSVTPELLHMARQTNDPAQRRDKALTFLSSSYYQKPDQFCDLLTATFPPESSGAAKIRAAQSCRLTFKAYAQRFDLSCKVWKLVARNPAHRATIAHNQLFNPDILPDTIVLGFEPDWANSTSYPDLNRG